MLLAIDAGNTNVVAALLDGGEVKARWRIATDPRRTGDEYAVWLNQLLLLEGWARSDIDRIIIATVVPRALHNLETLARKYFGVEPMVAGQGTARWPIALDVPQPETVGADRALNAMAAHDKFPGDLVVIDFGTATTFDHVDFAGAYKGGIIVPGINLSIDALVAAAAKLPRIAIAEPADHRVIADTTEGQMLAGIYWGYVALIEGLVERMKREIGRPVTVIATGGLALLFDKRSGLFDTVEPDLTIRGLWLLAEGAR